MNCCAKKKPFTLEVAVGGVTLGERTSVDLVQAASCRQRAAAGS